jgi:hypothetical protein
MGSFPSDLTAALPNPHCRGVGLLRPPPPPPLRRPPTGRPASRPYHCLAPRVPLLMGGGRQAIGNGRAPQPQRRQSLPSPVAAAQNSFKAPALSASFSRGVRLEKKGGQAKQGCLAKAHAPIYEAQTRIHFSNATHSNVT